MGWPSARRATCSTPTAIIPTGRTPGYIGRAASRSSRGSAAAPARRRTSSRSALPIPRSSTSGRGRTSVTGCAACAASIASRRRSASPTDRAAAPWPQRRPRSYDCSQSRSRRKCSDLIASWVLPIRSPSDSNTSYLQSDWMYSRRLDRSAPRSSSRVVSALSTGVLQERGRVAGPARRSTTGESVMDMTRGRTRCPGWIKGKGHGQAGALGTPATVVAEPASVARRRSGDGRGAPARPPPSGRGAARYPRARSRPVSEPRIDPPRRPCLRCFIVSRRR